MLLWCSGGNGGTEWDGRQDYISSQQFQELKILLCFSSWLIFVVFCPTFLSFHKMQLKNCSGAVGYICNALSSTGTDIKETAANHQLVVMTRPGLTSPRHSSPTAD